MRTLPVLLLGLSTCTTVPANPDQAHVDITVREGTSMAVAISPDGRTLAIDLQGSIWTLPASGGRATRITDPFNDARQPAWSPDGRLIAFQGFRDGGYDIWVVTPDGSGQRKLTEGPFDDREPAWSRDGTRIAFSSDREGATGSYDIFTVDVRSGDVRRVTSSPGDDWMPTWAPGDTAIAFISERGRERMLSVVTPAGGEVRTVGDAAAGLDAPSWGPGGEIVVHLGRGQTSSLYIGGRSITGEENAFPFRASWASPTEIVYTSDGQIRRRAVAGGAARTIPFSATLTVARADYQHRDRDPFSAARRTAKGIVAPALSPNAERVAFAALGDIWVMRIGEAPVKLTDDHYLDTEPAWSPDGMKLAWSSDRGGQLLDLWIHDFATNQARQLTRIPTSAMGAAWSRDGARIAFLDVDAIWRRASVSVVDVATGTLTKIQESTFGPGNPTWSPDGRHVAIAALVPYSGRFREGTNQIRLIGTGVRAGMDERTSAATGSIFAPIPDKSIDSRVGAGPVWSPDGTKMLFVHDGVLWVVPVDHLGAPTGEARRLTSEMAHAPTWGGDSRRVLYQSMDTLRLLDTETGAVRTVPLELQYAPSIPDSRVVVHAGRLADMTSPRLREDVDVLIDGNRIVDVRAHSAAAHEGRRVVDATGLTVMPGLIEHHTHLQKDFGEAHGRAWLAFGITTVRSPGGTPYEAMEDREAVDAGVRPGPRLFTAGYLNEWQRVYYKMAVAIASERHLEMELARSFALDHDMIKSYVRMPDLQQRRIVEFAHEHGIPASSHEVYPSAMIGIDAVEHTTGTSRRGYSPKVTTLQRSYEDVSAIVAASRMTITPTLTLGPTWLRRIVVEDAALARDPRFDLLPPWLSAQVRALAPDKPPGDAGGRTGAAAPSQDAGPIGEMLMRMHRAGARIAAGTDTPNPANLHAELRGYVAAGMTPYEALRSATVASAEALRLPAGTIERGKLADLIVVDGNPFEDLRAAYRVRTVIANGRVFPLDSLLGSTR